MFFRRSLHRIAFVMSSLLLALAAPADAAWQANNDDSLLFDVRLADLRLGDGVRGYQTPNGICINLPDIILALDVVLQVDASQQTLKGWAFDERNSIAIDRPRRTSRVGSRIAPLPTDAVRDTPNGWCVLTAELGRWLGVELIADTSNALLIVRSDNRLPVQSAAERNARREARTDTAPAPALAKVDLPYRPWRTPSFDITTSLSASRSAAGPIRSNRMYEIFSAGEVAWLSSEARLASDRSGTPDSLRMRFYRTDPDARLLGPLRATNLAFGDVDSHATSLVSSSVAGRGFKLGNRPTNLPDRFDTTTFRGDLPTGWDAEIYHNGELLSIACIRKDGRYEFLDVPLHFGANDFEIIRYGPQGQVRRESHRLMVGAQSVAPGKIQWWAGATRDQQDLISWRPRDVIGNTWRVASGGELGIDKRTSIGLSSQSIAIAGTRTTFVELLARRSLGTALAEVSGATDLNGGKILRAEILGRILNTNFALETLQNRDFRSERIDPTLRARQSLAINRTMKIASHILPIHFDLSAIDRIHARNLAANARIGLNTRHIAASIEVGWRRQRTPLGPPSSDAGQVGLLLNSHIGPVRLRGGMRWRVSGECRFEDADLAAEWSSARGDNWRIDMAYGRNDRILRSGLSYTREFPKFALALAGQAASDGSLASQMTLLFSLGNDARGRLSRVTAVRQTSGGQVIARVFRDTNANAVRDPDEPFLDNVGIRVANVPQPVAGRENAQFAAISGLPPFVPVAIAVDTASLIDPLDEPSTDGVLITPRAGVTTRIELGVASSGGLEGMLRPPASLSAASLTLELINPDGRTAAVTRPDFDGFFQFERLRYGRYQLIARGRGAQIYRAAVGEIVITAQKPTVRIGSVHLEPGP